MRGSWAASVCLFVLISCLHGRAELQQGNAEQRGAPQKPATEAPSYDAQQTASVSGVVTDASGATVADTQVILVPSDNRQVQTLASGPHGEFTFAAVPTGFYRVQVSAAGFATFLSQEFGLTPQQVYTVPRISLSVAAIAADVTVRPIELIAAEQLRAEEKQRLLGVVPNFYVSYVPDAAPLNARQKLSLAARDAFDWVSFVGITMAAGLQHAGHVHPGYGRGASGYAKRWAAFAADDVSDELLGHYVFPSLLHQDPRYFYQGTGTTKSRFYHALSSAVVARNDSGKLMPNCAYLLGDLSSAALSNAYYPRRDRSPTWFLINALLGVAGRAGQAVAEEFIGKRLTKNAPGGHSSHLPGSREAGTARSHGDSASPSAASPHPKALH